MGEKPAPDAARARRGRSAPFYLQYQTVIFSTIKPAPDGWFAFFRIPFHIRLGKTVLHTASRIDMHKAGHTTKITLTITEDVRRQLETWAQQNLTSLSAEMLRAVRFRASAERNTEVAVD